MNIVLFCLDFFCFLDKTKIFFYNSISSFNEQPILDHPVPEKYETQVKLNSKLFNTTEELTKMKETTITDNEPLPQLQGELEDSLSDKEMEVIHHQNEAYESDDEDEEVQIIHPIKCTEKTFEQTGSNFERSK